MSIFSCHIFDACFLYNSTGTVQRGRSVAEGLWHRLGPQSVSHLAGRGGADFVAEAEGGQWAWGGPAGVLGGHYRHNSVQAYAGIGGDWDR